MENPTEQAIQRSARWMSVVLTLAFLGVVILAVCAIAMRIVAPHGFGQFLTFDVNVGQVPLNGAQMTGLLALCLVGLLGWGLVLWWARSIFAQFALGVPGPAVQLAQRIAIALWLILLWQIAAPALGSIIATWHFPEGQRAIAISLGLGHAGTLLSALVASSMAKALSFGIELWHDNKEIV